MKANKTKALVQTAFIFALAIILSLIENSIPTFIAIPGVKIGLSNIAVMYALFFIGIKSALATAILKALFVLIIRAPVASFLSLFGGILSVIIMFLLLEIFSEKISYLVISAIGSVFHNIGQFIAISIVYQSVGLFAYLPLLIICGIIAGITTSVMLKILLPAIRRLNLQ